MKKIYTLLVATLLVVNLKSKAQDTLFYEGFQFVMNSYTDTSGTIPTNTVDAMCYNIDIDLLTPHTGAGFRSRQWWQTLAFADADLYTTAGFPDTNIVFTSSSWFDNASTPRADDWFITKNLLLGNHDTLFWKSAPFQTPRYCDGYQVLLSHTSNDISTFTDTLFIAAEMATITGSNDSTFSGYTFTPPNKFIHGFDNTYTEYHAVSDSARLRGVLRPFFVPLDNHGNQNVFIAFRHYSYDDNFISIDDILVRGDRNHQGIHEYSNQLSLSLSPNPSTNQSIVSYTLKSQSFVKLSVFDISGKLVFTQSNDTMTQGQHSTVLNTSEFAKGFYTLTIQSTDGISSVKLIVQ
ncbi:MAG: T9SS type A sorting domain-containing protein [Bacteroidota bacterium]